MKSCTDCDNLDWGTDNSNVQFLCCLKNIWDCIYPRQIKDLGVKLAKAETCEKFCGKKDAESKSS